MPDSHSHPHSHSHDARNTNVRRLVLALAITGAFIGVEAVAGLIANSLALLTDAAHNLTDALALVLSWHALALASRPPSGRRTYGYHRAGILIALFNSTTLALMALGIFYEAYRRFVSPPTVNADLLIGVGIVAFVVNAGTALIVRRGSEGDLNMRSAFVHLAGDAISTLGAVLAGVAIKLTGWEWLDPLVSVLIGGLILWSGWKIIRETVTILMEGTPAGLDMRLLVRDLLSVEGVQGVHDVHAWSITGSLRAFSAHVLTKDMSISAGAGIQRQINALLREKYQIGHATLQLECQGCEPDLLYCDLVPADDHEHAEPVPG